MSLMMFFVFTSGCGGKTGEESLEITTENDKVSYSLGYNIGTQIMQNFMQNNFEVNPDIFTRAVKDVLSGSKQALTQEEMMAVMEKFQSDTMAEQQKAVVANLEATNAFLEQNKSKAGITVLDSGVQYQVIKEGSGPKPKVTDTVKVHYRGTLLDGKQFDSSYDRGEPIEFALNQVIPGWSEAVQLMQVGSNWKIFIPPDLAYGENGQRGIPPNSLLIFEMELLEIVQ